jgi:hypothetical protein
MPNRPIRLPDRHVGEIHGHPAFADSLDHPGQVALDANTFAGVKSK